MFRSYSFRLMIISILLFVLGFPVFGADKNIVIEPTSSRVALIIGIKDYIHLSPLTNPLHDAEDIKSAFSRLGFQKIVYLPNAPDKQSMIDAIREFKSYFGKNTEAVVYYSGHGAQADGINYLIPKNANIASKTELQHEGVELTRILGEMADAENKINIIFLDACRTNVVKGFKGYNGDEAGWARMDSPKNTLIAYATRPGSVAEDFPTEQNSTWTKFLKDYLQKPGLKIRDMLDQVGSDVLTFSGSQEPWMDSSSSVNIGGFCFAGCIAISQPNIQQTQIKTPAQPTIQSAHIETTTLVINKTNTDTGCELCPEMVEIPKQGFAIGKYEITQSLWRKVMGNNPSEFKQCGDDCPVEQVSYMDIQVFLKLLNSRTGKKFRLPNNDEWAAACFAGEHHIYCGSDNLDEVAWYNGNSKGQTNPRGLKKPNAWGIFDMSGNVLEWRSSCKDEVPGDCFWRFAGGGAWNSGLADIKENDLRAENSWARNPRYTGNIGFRLAQDL